mmetsp:Transcript_60661/g.123785  ORF Transcript_60661/g.123785 Transcript_60661/m.123785 type:complete len:121 (-) Transcript_60661:1257-1619(-)
MELRIKRRLNEALTPIVLFLVVIFCTVNADHSFIQYSSWNSPENRVNSHTVLRKNCTMPFAKRYLKVSFHKGISLLIISAYECLLMFEDLRKIRSNQKITIWLKTIPEIVGNSREFFKMI